MLSQAHCKHYAWLSCAMQRSMATDEQYTATAHQLETCDDSTLGVCVWMCNRCSLCACSFHPEWRASTND
jgi:hypothetical protein